MNPEIHIAFYEFPDLTAAQMVLDSDTFKGAHRRLRPGVGHEGVTDARARPHPSTDHHLVNRTRRSALPIAQISSAAAAIQIAMMTAAAARLEGWRSAWNAAARCSEMISGGMSFTARKMPAGTMSKSSTWPRIGMKSGMRSMGLSARRKAKGRARLCRAYEYEILRCAYRAVRAGRSGDWGAEFEGFRS